MFISNKLINVLISNNQQIQKLMCYIVKILHSFSHVPSVIISGRDHDIVVPL